MGHLEDLKVRYLRQLSGVESFRDAWLVWEPAIRGLVGPNFTGSNLFDLGDNLAQIFRTTASGGRSQGSLSAGGTVWECLVCWYLNLIFWGTPVFVARQNRNFVPSVINDAICVTISNVQTNTESDIVMFSIPDVESVEGPSLAHLNSHILSRMNKVDMCVLQCKTNWNDNAQIPMLWDLIYNSSTFRIPYVSVGRNGVNPSSFRQFSYAFATVPSNSSPYLPNHTSVIRVRGLTGGNYWGNVTTSNVAASIKELAGRRFPSYFSGGIVAHLDNAIASGSIDVEGFLQMKWETP